NPYYYMAGRHGIHPTYVQTMLSDNRYENDEILTVINEIKKVGGRHFTPDSLELARRFYTNPPQGNWDPEDLLEGRSVLILGTGPKIYRYSKAIEQYIERNQPLVIALNKQTPVAQDLIGVRAACRPLRILADLEDHLDFPQPLIMPISMLPEDIAGLFAGKETMDYGIMVQEDTFEVHDNYCVLPYSLVIAYVLAVCIRGGAGNVLMAGFDGYLPDDPRTLEMNNLISFYYSHPLSAELIAVTPTKYNITQDSIFNPDLSIPTQSIRKQEICQAS
ncbi:MAG: hypothetical protein ACOC0W_02730, partial [Desulfosalsimonas sp.]